jgi:hypothetical protein
MVKDNIRLLKDGIRDGIIDRGRLEIQQLARIIYEHTGQFSNMLKSSHLYYIGWSTQSRWEDR